MTEGGPLTGTMEPGVTSFGPSWQTPASVAEVAPLGWAALDAEHEIAIVVDPRVRLPNGAPIFARLTYRSALEVAARERARLISREEVQELQERAGIVGPLVALPDDAIRASAAGPLAQRAGESRTDWDQRLRGAGMLSLSWALHHDGRWWSKVGSWPAGALVARAGKHWIDGAPPGFSFLFGWWNGSKWIQTAPPPGATRAFHDDQHHDYATTTILVRRRDGQAIGPSTTSGAAAAGSSSGSAAGWLLALLLIPGPLTALALAANWPAVKRAVNRYT